MLLVWGRGGCMRLCGAIFRERDAGGAPPRWAAAPRNPHGYPIVQNRLKSKSPAPMDAAARSLRAVHRAASDLRRGTPILLNGNDHVLVIAGAETVGIGGLAEIASCATDSPVLLVAPARGGA